MPTEITFDFTELKKFLPKLEKMIPVWYERALTDYGLILEQMVVDEIEERHISVSGALKQSITSQVKKQLFGWLVKVGTNLKTIKGYPYPVGVHEGTTAHWAPIKPIEEWVRRKGIAGTYSIKTHRRTGKASVKLAQDKAAAYAIQRSIAKKGTKGNPFMESVFVREKHKIRQEIGGAMLRAMKGGKIV